MRYRDLATRQRRKGIVVLVVLAVIVVLAWAVPLWRWLDAPPPPPYVPNVPVPTLTSTPLLPR